MSRKKKHHEEHVDESWLLPYADLLTLLLALFIVMFAMSSLDKAKFEELSRQLNIIFAGGSTKLMDKQGNAIITVEQAGTQDNDTTVKNKAIEEDMMIEIKRRIEQEIKNNGYWDKVKVVLNREGLEISIQDVVLFNSGDAEVLESVSPLLIQISKILASLDNSIKIVGHTDNKPIHTNKFRSNWDLSAMRAINVMSFLVDQGQLKPERFSVQGYGEYSPKFDNATEEGRAKNRRVEIVLIRKYPLNNEPVISLPIDINK